MISDRYGAAFQLKRLYIAELHARPRARFQRQIQHLVEIIIVDIALLVDADQRSAHDGIEIGILVGGFK